MQETIELFVYRFPMPIQGNGALLARRMTYAGLTFFFNLPHFPWSADRKKDWQPHPVGTQCADSDDHTHTPVDAGSVRSSSLCSTPSGRFLRKKMRSDAKWRHAALS